MHRLYDAAASPGSRLRSPGSLAITLSKPGNTLQSRKYPNKILYFFLLIKRVGNLSGNYQTKSYEFLILCKHLKYARYMNNEQLSSEGEMKTGGYISRREEARYILYTSSAWHRPAPRGIVVLVSIK